MSSSSVSRFNLLLLEEGEIFFEDYAATLYLSNKAETRKLAGQLKVASKNLIFVPHSVSYPITRYSYHSIVSLHMDKAKQHLIVVTSQVVSMKAHNVIAPYHFKEYKESDGTFVFEPSYSRLNDFIQLIAQIYQITKSGDSGPRMTERIHKIQCAREEKIPFDSSWFDYNESAQLSKPFTCVINRPLVEIRCQLMVTNKRIYLQPFHKLSSVPMMKYNLCDCTCVYKRRHSHQHIALEILFANDTNLLLSFDDSKLRDCVYTLLLPNSDSSFEWQRLEEMQRQWCDGKLSNYEYLLFLNQRSGRSFNDLTQYPVFPWIITDYESESIDLSNENIYRDLSKPVGALNPERLNKILQRYKQMSNEESEQRFMYGSHYSTPGYVMYFLVRQYPEYMLRFQNGRFDAPDRLFSSVKRSWDSAFHSLTDVKELIPHFYGTDPSFLLNLSNLNLGVRSDKTEVHNVCLPKWADNSPKRFLAVMRQALESEHTSANIHKWIDLIFGYKQTGVHAENAYNKFYYLTYEGSVDIQSIRDENELKSIKMQINEFGQTPSQLFKKPHPQRYSSSSEEKEVQSLSNEWTNIASGSNKEYASLTISPHAHRITDLCISDYCNSQYLFSTSHDSSLGIYCLDSDSDKSDKNRHKSIKISHLALSSVVSDAKGNIFVGSWDNNIYVYSLSAKKVVSVNKSHSDAVSCLCLSPRGRLVSGSWDKCVKIWDWDWDKCAHTYSLSSEVRCVDSSKSSGETLFVSGDESGNVRLFDERESKAIRVWNRAHKDELSSIAWVPNTKSEFVSCSTDCAIKHWNASNGKLISSIALRENLNCIQTDGKVVMAGGDLGQMRLFNINQKLITEITQNCSLKLNTNNSISRICVANGGDTVVCGTKQYTNNIHVFKLKNEVTQVKSLSKSAHRHNNDQTHRQTTKKYSFGAFAKFTQSASNLFSFGSNSQK